MKVSLNLIRFYQKMYQWSGETAPDGVDALVQKIGAQLGGVDEVIDIGAKYQGAIIAKVVSCHKHENSDHLNVCRIDDGGKTPDVERGEDGLVQVVCGAPNVREGLTVVWLPPGSTVPESYGKDPFVLGARELRGVTSNGMLASMRELALGESHDGIVEADGDKVPGTPFVEAYGLDDHIIDIENKMFTHRPDLFGHIGVAREIAGIQGQAFKSPEWYTLDAQIPEAESKHLKVTLKNELPGLVPRFILAPMSDVTVGDSPLWLQTYLQRLGIRSINNIVDLTNYYSILTGQPMHAYDYDKVKERSNDDSAAITVRYPRPGEKLLLLNGKEIEPRSEAIMIATDKELIGLAGVMGGGDTEVDEHTKNIIFEVATFDMYSVRRTSMAHGLFTDAVTRYNKGQSPLQNTAVVAKAIEHATELSGAKLAGDIVDDNQVAGREWVHPPVPVTAQFINQRLGLSLSSDEIKTLLENVEFTVAADGNALVVAAPFWRTDVEIREDVVEEVGRLYGFDKLPLELPQRSIKPVQKEQGLEVKNAIRLALKRNGANEVLNYTFVHGDLLEKVGQDKEQAFAISNALSPDLQYYRLSIVPSLLASVHGNNKAGYGEFALFELGKAHGRSEMDESGLPKEFERVALVFAADTKTAAAKYAGAAFYEARSYLLGLLDECGTQELTFVPLPKADFADHELLKQMAKPYEPNRAAVLHNGKRIVGVVGEFRASVRKALKLPDFCAGFELFTAELAVTGGKKYVPLPRFPKVSQDITLKVAASLPHQELSDFLASNLAELKPEHSNAQLTPIDIYQRADDVAHKQVTLRLNIASYEMTLTDKEVANLLDKVTGAAAEKFSAERI